MKKERQRARRKVPPLVGPQPVQIHSDEWWSFDTAETHFFHEKCCGCGLVHKTHVRIEGTRLFFRNERLDGEPDPKEVDNSKFQRSNPAVRFPPTRKEP